LRSFDRHNVPTFKGAALQRLLSTDGPRPKIYTSTMCISVDFPIQLIFLSPFWPL